MPPEPDFNPSGFFQSMFSSLLGAASEGQVSSSQPTSGSGRRQDGTRELSFNFPGGGRGSVTFGPLGGGSRAGDPGGGLDA